MTEIDTGRLVLRPIQRDEARALVGGATPAGTVFAEGYPSRFSLEVMEMLVAGNQLGPFGPYFMVRKADGAVIGEIGCSVADESGRGEVGYSVVEPAWGQGYATEALAALLDHVLGQPGMHRVIAHTLVDHTASRRVLEKAGMRYSGSRAGVEDGESVELVVYEITKPGAPTAMS